MIALIFDVETTGIPKFRNAPFRDLEVYDDARIVSIAWQLLDTSYEESCDYDCDYHIIKPENFVIPDDAIAIHGITNEMAHAEGAPIELVLKRFAQDIMVCDVMVAHNIKFDINILRSELYRLYMQDVIEATFQKKIFCTMYESRNMGVVDRFTKLAVLYEMLFPDDAKCENAHNAMYDVLYCARVYKHLVNLVSKDDIENEESE